MTDRNVWNTGKVRNHGTQEEFAKKIAPCKRCTQFLTNYMSRIMIIIVRRVNGKQGSRKSDWRMLSENEGERECRLKGLRNETDFLF